MYLTEYRLRINDINYGGHLGAAQLGFILHDARVRLLHDGMGYKDELNIDGYGLILTSDTANLYSEAFYGETLIVSVDPVLEGAKLYIDYVVCVKDRKVATSRVELRFFDYKARKTVKPPKGFRDKLLALKEV